MQSLISSILFATAANAQGTFPLGAPCTVADTCDDSNACVIRFGDNDTSYADYFIQDGVDGSLIDPAHATCEPVGATVDGTQCAEDPALQIGCIASVSYCPKDGVCTALPVAGQNCIAGGMCAVVSSELLQCFLVTAHVAAPDVTALGFCGSLASAGGDCSDDGPYCVDDGQDFEDFACVDPTTVEYAESTSKCLKLLDSGDPCEDENTICPAGQSCYGGEGSKVCTDNTDTTTGEPSDTTTGEPSDTTTGEGSDTTTEPESAIHTITAAMVSFVVAAIAL